MLVAADTVDRRDAPELPMDDRRSFGSVLKRFRVAAGLTHEGLAERAGLGARTISDLERGESRAPRPATLELLVEALGLSAEQRTELLVAARPELEPPRRPPLPATTTSNLPTEMTSFLGRTREMEAIRGFVARDDVRLVTLTGPGGTGKTRLAFRVAADLRETFAGGVVAVSLAPVVDGDGVVQAIGRALNGRVERRWTAGSLVEAMGNSELLLVLDNCEHLLDAAPLVAGSLQGSPHLKVIATSRAALRISGEQEFPVPPLPDNTAIELFVERAKRARPDFALSPANEADVAAICARLDGLPLAIELAAARVKALPPRLLLERLGETPAGSSLHLLSGGPRDLPARHQTLRDTIAWSEALLTPEEQNVFRRLSVFASGFTLDAAEAVSPISVLDAVLSLVDKSLLVQGSGADGEPRYLMLETIRAYAWERLVAAGEATAMRRAHAEYYLAIVEATGALLFADSAKRLRLAAEQDNIQAALRWLVQPG
jgi:predicted ATPase/transcriptional regulator with XRE-family HTH domain